MRQTQFKPMKKKINFEVDPIKCGRKKNLEKVLELLKKKSIDEDVPSFEDTFTNNKSEIKQVIGKVVKYNRNLMGKYGKFSIVELKDIASDLIIVNLYKDVGDECW